MTTRTTTPTYRELQQQARTLGVKGNGTRQQLELALAAHDAAYHSEPQLELDAHILAYCEAQMEAQASNPFDAVELAPGEFHHASDCGGCPTCQLADRDALAELIADGTLTPVLMPSAASITTPEYTTEASMLTTTTQEQPMTTTPEPKTIFTAEEAATDNARIDAETAELNALEAADCEDRSDSPQSYSDLAAMRAAHFNQAMKAHSAVMAERLSQPQTDVVFNLPKTSRLDPRNLVNRMGLGGLTVTVDEADVTRTTAVEDHDAHVRAHKLSQSLYMGWAMDVADRGQVQVGTRKTKADVKRAEAHVRAAIAALRHAGYCDDHAVVADLERLMLTLGQCEGFKLPGMVMPTMYRSGSDGVLPQVINQLQGQVIQVERITASGKCQCGKPVWTPSKTGQCFRCTPNAPTTPVVKAATVATVKVLVAQVPVTMDRDEAIVVYGTVRPSTTHGKAPSSPVAASKPVQATSTLPTAPKPVLEAARAVPAPTAVVAPVAAPIPTHAPVGTDLEALAAAMYRTAGNIRTLQCRCQLAGIPWSPIEAKMTLCRKLAAKGVTL